MMKKMKELWNETGTRIKKADIIIMIIMVLVYGIYSFINLGDMKAPQTFASFSEVSQSVTIEVPNSTYITRMRVYTGNETGNFWIYLSEDGETYNYLNTLEANSVFSWQDVDINSNAKYVQLIAAEPNGSIGEVQLYDENSLPLEETATDDTSAPLVDELDLVPIRISYMNSTYFDEVYFARTAYEYVHGLPAYEWVHPPLGKLIQAIPIALMGMTPFAWRMAGNICGILMIAVMYILGKKLFKKRKWAITAALLMMLDTFHFAQSRMGTVDTELVLFSLLAVLFMVNYMQQKKNTKLWKRLLNLFFSGLFAGCAIATKWTGLAAGLILCIMFFYHLIKTNFGEGKKWTKDTTIIIICCFLFFIGVPVAIYVGSYFLFPNFGVNTQITNVQALLTQTEGIYNYHSTLTATHPYTSEWYTWPIMWKPVWYYVAEYSDGLRETISGIGNPAIWWGACVAMLYVIYAAIRKRDKVALFIILGVAVTWLPYLFIGRVMFLYHFFPTLPYMMFALVYALKALSERFKTDKITMVFLFIVFVLFALFLPIVSGRAVDPSYVNYFRWLPQWYF